MTDSKIVALRRPASDLAERLRELAALAEAGRLTDFITCYVLDDEFAFMFGASKLNAVAMASMLHDTALDRMRSK